MLQRLVVIEQWLISGAVVNDNQFGDYGYRIGHDGASHGKLASGKAVVYDTDLALGYVPRQMAKLKRLARSLE
jgi:hypothetical protein